VHVVLGWASDGVSAMTVAGRALSNIIVMSKQRISSYLEHPSLAEMKTRQSVKIREIMNALSSAGFRSLDAQAEVLGLSRSTTWTLRQDNHKTTGLSAKVICRILWQRELPPRVRAIILEYVEEKSSGYYGHTPAVRRKFIATLETCRQKQAKKLQNATAANTDRVMAYARPQANGHSPERFDVARRPKRSNRSS